MTLRATVQRRRRTLGERAENAHQTWTSRDALELTLRSEDGRTGVGECSPLPGFSPETLDDCARALERLQLAAVPERIQRADLRAQLACAAALFDPSLPAARCALETASLDLWSRALELPAWSLLRLAPEPPAPRPLAALLTDLESAERDLAAAAARGVRCFKLKIGRSGALTRELAVAHALQAALPPGGSLRLDANQSLSRAGLGLVSALAALAPEWVEEPCPPAQLGAFGRELPLALDESLCDLPLTEARALWRRTPNVRAVVLKPALHGVSRCLELAALAREDSLRVVLSHTFDGPATLALCAALALAVGSSDVAHGLDLAGARSVSRHPGFEPSAIVPWSAPGFALEAL